MYYQVKIERKCCLKMTVIPLCIKTRGKKNPIRLAEKKKRSQQDRRFSEPWNCVYQRPDALQAKGFCQECFTEILEKPQVAELQISWGSIDQKVTWMVWWAFIKLNKKLNGLYVQLNLLCFEVRVFLKQLLQSAWNWRGWGVEWGGLTFYKTLGKGCEMLFLPVCAER